jgi:hypothetical protein
LEDAVSPPTARRKLLWAGAIAAIAAGAFASAEIHGRSSRLPFRPPPGLSGRPVAMVGSAADAFRVWRAAGVRGRRLVVLTGQWSKPRNAKTRPPAPEEVAAALARGDMEIVDAGSALFTAARLGVVRSLDVVMPPPAFTHRLGEVSGRKELERGDGAFRLAFEGLERRFSTPRAFVAPAERVLVLVEPTWFTEGAPPDPLSWLSSSGAAWDLALIALEDPAANAEERQAALSYARAAGAPFLEAAE